MSRREQGVFYFTEAKLHFKIYFTECVSPTPPCMPEHEEGHPALAHSPVPLLHLLGVLSCVTSSISHISLLFSAQSPEFQVGKMKIEEKKRKQHLEEKRNKGGQTQFNTL